MNKWEQSPYGVDSFTAKMKHLVVDIVNSATWALLRPSLLATVIRRVVKDRVQFPMLELPEVRR